jgi:hypothetical protein
VSHFKERREKNCLNCNAEVIGRYCYVCGQENTPPKQSVGHLIKHFFDDVTHFDGKFFATLGTLIRRPGLLSLEYIRGRRASYVDPAKLYIFTSAVFFLIFFNTVGYVNDTFGATDINMIQNRVGKLSDSALKVYSLNTYDTILSRQELLLRARKQDSIRNTSAFVSFKTSESDSSEQEAPKVANVNGYDSLQKTLPSHKRDGFITRYIKRSSLRLDEARRRDPEHFVSRLINRILHLFPQMLFVSLPLFAFLLKLLYFRRKNFYYTDHVFFSIHLYTYTFISLLAFFGLKELKYGKGFNIISALMLLVILSIFFYLYKAMRTFYQQRRGKTILKFLLLNLSAFVLMVFLMIVFGFFGAFTFH